MENYGSLLHDRAKTIIPRVQDTEKSFEYF